MEKNGWGQALRGLPVAAIDFETTGLNKDDRWPVQVAVMHGNFGQLSTFTTVHKSLVNPPVDEVPEVAAKVHGLTKDKLVGAPEIPAMLDSLMPLLEGRVLMAYNAPYDWGVLNDCLRREGRPELPFLLLDPFVWAKRVDNHLRGAGVHNLAAVCKRRNIELEEAHDAQADIEATAKVAVALLVEAKKSSMLSTKTLESFGAFWAWQCVEAILSERDYLHWWRSNRDGLPSLPWHENLGVEA